MACMGLAYVIFIFKVKFTTSNIRLNYCARTPARWVVDRVMAPDIDAVSELVRSGALLRASEPLMKEV